MKRVIVACAGLLLLAGCSTAPAPAPTPTPVSAEATYLATMHALAAAKGFDGTDAQSISLAHTICRNLDASEPVDALILSIVNTDTISEADTRTVVRAAVLAYCPTHKDLVSAL